MSPARLILLFSLAAASAAAQSGTAPTALNEALKKVTARYARTEERIQVVVGRRLHPQPLPATLANPFYRGAEMSEIAQPEPAPEEAAPAAPDITDADTLARLAPTLRIGGVVVRNQQPYLTINSIVCKVGDIVPISGGKDAPIFIQIRKINPDSVLLGLNDAELTLSLKR